MRTTLEITDELLRAAKKRAADEGVPLREIVERALRAFLNGGTREPYRLRWHPATSGRVIADVDLDRRGSRTEFFDREDADRRRSMGLPVEDSPATSREESGPEGGS